MSGDVQRAEEFDTSARRSRIRVLICDDSSLFADAVQELLEEGGCVAVVGRAEDGDAAVEAALRLRPDVVIMDMAMPSRSGIDATTEILSQWPEARVIAVSAYAHNVYLKRFRAARARGFLSKDSVHEDLVDAVRSVHDGGEWFSLGGMLPPRS